MFNRIYRNFFKRLLDILLATLLCFFLLLPMFIIAAVIRIDSDGGAIFRQKRRGKNGKEFVCYKFRTMYENSPHNLSAAQFKDYDRYVTRVGRFLRRSSLDELPQLFNVIKGDMSLVGPRPLICEECDMHEMRQSEGVYKLRPGITGMAQISGRNLLDNSQKLQKDAYYLHNLGLMLDVRILFQTLLAVIKKEGIENKKGE
jgi:O-antigen biosynthesis protein WbqP